MPKEKRSLLLNLVSRFFTNIWKKVTMNNVMNKIVSKSIFEPKTKKILWLIGIIIILIAYIIIALLIPPPKLKADTKEFSPPITSFASAISWPAYGQAAIGVSGSGVLAENGEQKSAPIASIAKTILALSILEKNPISPGENGPTITMTQADVDIFTKDLAQNSSVVPVKVGEQFTEYEMLQALMIPSGNNIANSLAVWGFGSVENYLSYANDFVAKLGLNQTRLFDPHGLSPQTVSSAHDLIILGEKALANPVLAEIVNQKQLTLPTGEILNNYNTILGQDGIIGIKTGNTDEAGGCLLFATKQNISGQDIVIIGAILGASNRNQALQDTKKFIEKNVPNFQVITPVKAGDVVGTYKVPWGKTVNIVAEKDLSVLVVNKEKITIKTNLNEINAPQNKDTEVGQVTATYGSTTVSVPVVINSKISKPSIFWRLLHP